MTAALLDDLLLRGERALELRLAGCALLRPWDVAALDIRPEIALDAVAFFERFDRRREEIIHSEDELRCIAFAWRCAGRGAWRFYRSIEGLNTFIYLPTLPDEIRALRAVRKGLVWIERQPELAALIERELQPHE